MHPIHAEFINRVRDGVDRGTALGRLSSWIERNTRIGVRPFSFVDHEFQKEIIDDTSIDLVVRKPSQVGMSECMVRLMLGFLGTIDNVVGLFTMPTIGEAQRFSKSRMDPVIEQSKTLRLMMAPGSDSSSFKRIGTSQLFMVGTFGKAIISIPTDLLVNDEIDFSNPEAIATAESRLSHSRFIDESTGVRGIRRKFSTPTVDAYGVSALFNNSDQRFRLVKCRHCAHEFWPNLIDHCVVNTWDKPIADLTYLDVEVLDEYGELETARLLCPSCHGVIKKDNLGPEYRRWVAAKPGHTRRGYAVSPFDLPAYHTPASLLRKLKDYKQHTSHFYNFGLGLPHSDSSNSIVLDVVQRNTLVTPVPPDVAKASGVQGCIAGLDVGKTSWFVVGKPRNATQFDVLWYQPILLRGDGSGLRDTVLELLDAYGVNRLVCDAQPYTDSILAIQSGRPEGWVLPNLYSLRDKTLPQYMVREKKDGQHEVTSNRTKVLDFTTKKVNNGDIRFPAMVKDSAVFEKHLMGMKRVERDDDGDVVADWVKTGDDHYFHALNYAVIAFDSLATHGIFGFSSVNTIGFTQASVGRTARDDEQAAIAPALLGGAGNGRILARRRTSILG